MCACPRHLNRPKTAQNFNPSLRKTERRAASHWFLVSPLGILLPRNGGPSHSCSPCRRQENCAGVFGESGAFSFSKKTSGACLTISWSLHFFLRSLVAPAVGHRQLYDGHHCRLLLCLSALTSCACHSALGLAFVCPSLPVRLSLSLPGAERASLVWPLVRYCLVRSALNALKAGKATNAHRVVRMRPIYTNAHPSRSALHSTPQEARRSPKSARPRARSLSHCLSKRPTRCLYTGPEKCCQEVSA